MIALLLFCPLLHGADIVPTTPQFPLTAVLPPNRNFCMIPWSVCLSQHCSYCSLPFPLPPACIYCTFPSGTQTRQQKGSQPFPMVADVDSTVQPVHQITQVGKPSKVAHCAYVLFAPFNLTCNFLTLPVGTG